MLRTQNHRVETFHAKRPEHTGLSGTTTRNGLMTIARTTLRRNETMRLMILHECIQCCFTCTRVFANSSASSRGIFHICRYRCLKQKRPMTSIVQRYSVLILLAEARHFPARLFRMRCEAQVCPVGCVLRFPSLLSHIYLLNPQAISDSGKS